MRYRRQYLHQKTIADALASTATSDAAFEVQADGTDLIAVNFIPHAALTADATDFATLAIKVGSTTKASATTELAAGGGSGDWVDNVPEPLAIASSSLAKGDEVLVTIAKAASGVAVPIGVWQIVVSEPHFD